ncbi:MAG TPA: T9SS type A sorting domain-containing protein, partial [Ignavibacteria bacterium]|nr:T9SS type A sorting domain-containing protein [Ignavibacteria bacterium]
MKNIKSFLLLIMLLNIVSFSQTQEKIPWSSLADSPWPVARGDVQGTGRSEFVGPKNPIILWKKTYPLGISNGPIMGNNGKLYFGTMAGNFGFNESYFYCTDSEGELIWRFSTNSWFPNESAPVIDLNENVYFGTSNNKFFALNIDGTLKWKHSSNSAYNLSNNVIDKYGNIYTASDDSLFSFNINGEIIFKISVGSILAKGLSFSPSGDTLYAPASIHDSKEGITYYFLYAINLSGEILWQKEFDQLNRGTPLVDNSNNIYVQGRTIEDPQKRSLISLNPDGSIKWEFSDNITADIWFGSPTMDHEGNISFFGSAKIDGEFRPSIISVDYYGNLRWIYPFEEEDWFVFPLEIVHGLICDADGTVYAAAERGYYMYAINKNGELLWKIPLGDYYIFGNPVIGKDGIIYLGMHRGAFANNLVDNLIAIGEKPNSVNEEELPSVYKLEQNYPNPFNPSTTIKFSLPERSEVKLSIFNLLGQEIEILFQGEKEAGSYEYVFENKSLSTGVYFYVLESQQVRLSRKMM